MSAGYTDGCAKQAEPQQEVLYDWFSHEIAYHQQEMLRCMELQKQLGQYGIANMPMDFMRKLSREI